APDRRRTKGVPAVQRSIVFINSVFPCLSETFVFDQFEALRSAGLSLEIVSNHRPALDQVHPRMKAIQAQVDYLCDAGFGEILVAHALVFCRHPLRYLRALLRVPFAEEKT